MLTLDEFTVLEVITQLSGLELRLSHCLVMLTVFLYFLVFSLFSMIVSFLLPKEPDTVFSLTYLCFSPYIHTHAHTHTIWNLPPISCQNIYKLLHLDLPSLFIFVLRRIPSISDQFLHMLSRFCFLKPFLK